MNFEVHTQDDNVDVYRDSFTFTEGHRGLWVRSEIRHEFRMEPWGDLSVSRHVRRVSHGLVERETESREEVQTYSAGDAEGSHVSAINILGGEITESIEPLKQGSRRAWFMIDDLPAKRPRTLSELERWLADRK